MKPRHRPRNAEGTRLEILSAATRAFSERGLEGARIDEIAALSGVNKRMIYVYFGSKDRLYMEVLRTHFDRVLEVGQPVAGTSLAPREQAAAAITRYFRFLAENPGFVRLLNWEVVGETQRVKAVLAERAAAGLEQLHDIVRAGVRSGAFRRDLDVRMLVMSANALCLGYFTHRPLAEALWRQDLKTPDRLEAALTHILELIFHGIGSGAARPPPRRRAPRPTSLAKPRGGTTP